MPPEKRYLRKRILKNKIIIIAIDYNKIGYVK